MSKAILGFGVSVTRLAALAGSKLASTPSNDDIVKLITDKHVWIICICFSDQKLYLPTCSHNKIGTTYCDHFSAKDNLIKTSILF